MIQQPHGGEASTVKSSRYRRTPRNWCLRLGFLVLVLAYAALTIFTGSRAIPKSTDQASSFIEKIDSNKMELTVSNSFNDDNDGKGKIMAGKFSANNTEPSSLNFTVQDTTIITDRKMTDATLLDNRTVTTQKASAVTTMKRHYPKKDKVKRNNKNNNKAKNKKKKRVRGVQEKMLQEKLHLDLDESPFDPSSLHASLKEFYEHIPLSYNYSSHIWDEPTVRLPNWMKRYLRWHYHVRIAISSKSSQDATQILPEGEPLQYLVMQCMGYDAHCGGVSDRLKPLPFILRIAYYTKRVLLIHWTRPSRLENFLVPPRHGMDWRLPSWMEPKMKEWDSGVFTFAEDNIRPWSRTNLTLVRSRFQDYHGGKYAYNEQLMDGEPNFDSVFHDVWRLCFTPAAPVRAILESDMKRLGLIPGNYVAAHLRALYATEDRSENIKRSWARNAVNCASELRPRKTIFFVSDSMNATIYARQYGERRNATVITRVPDPNPPFHMDKVRDWRRRNISDFYDSFIDIYIMGQADCVTYNKGGYGLLGLFMSRNASCGVRQDALDRPVIHNPCRWVDDPDNGTLVTRDSRPSKPILVGQPIYGEPMENTIATYY